MVQVNKSEMDVNVGRKKRKKGIGGHKVAVMDYAKVTVVSKWAYYEFSNFYFIPLPKPCLQFRRNLIEEKRLQDHIRKCIEREKSDNWVQFYRRRDDKFNLTNKVRSYSSICSLHFVGESGPQNNIQILKNLGKETAKT